SKDKVDYLWHLIQQHQKHNVSLVCGKRFENTVTLSKKSLTAELVLQEKGKDLALVPQIVHEQEKWNPEEWMRVGEPPHFLVHFNNPLLPNHSDLTFYALEGNPKLLQHFKKPVHIPQKSIKEFSQTFLPTLTREYKVVNTSSQVILPEFISPKIQVKVASRGENKIHTEFHLKYGEKTFPLNHRGHEVEWEEGKTA